MNIRKRQLVQTLSLLLPLLIFSPAAANDLDPLLAKIKAVGKEGAGNVEAVKALQHLSRQGPEALTAILAGMDDANPIAINYLRSAFEAIADKALSQGKPLPADQLEAFVKDTERAGKARRLAYEWLIKLDPDAPDRLLPGMVNDPGPELRRDAVARLLEQAEKYDVKSEEKQARSAYQTALKYARDRDQVEKIAGKLKTFGIEIDLTKHFGFITEWMVVAPFDNRDGIGFAKSYPPDQKVDLSATYTSRDGKKIGWKNITTDKKLGTVDFNDVFSNWRGVVGYAYTVVHSPEQRPVEIRSMSNNAVRIYLNGKEVYSRDEYHHGMSMDQHTGTGTLRQGRNEILVKVCQNEQTDTWAQNWSFNLRVTDHLGTPVPIKVEVREP